LKGAAAKPAAMDRATESTVRREAGGKAMVTTFSGVVGGIGALKP